MEMHDCPLCGCAAEAVFGPDKRFSRPIGDAWPNEYAWRVQCNHFDCNAPTFTRRDRDSAVAGWNAYTNKTPNAVVTGSGAESLDGSGNGPLSG